MMQGVRPRVITDPPDEASTILRVNSGNCDSDGAVCRLISSHTFLSLQHVAPLQRAFAAQISSRQTDYLKYSGED
jgi:hypothetical protein